MTERNDDPIADIKAAVDEAVERMFSDKLSVEDYARLINRVFDNLPDFFKQPLQPVPEPLPGDLRERLGRRVREAWIEWAKRQENPKPSWLVPYDKLNESDKEADRCIGSAIWADCVAEHASAIAVSQLPVPAPLPWLDQPDGVGLFWFIDDSKPKNAPWLIDIDPNGDGSPLCYRTGSEEFDYLDDLKGRWQRIPQPVMPGEAGK